MEGSSRIAAAYKSVSWEWSFEVVFSLFLLLLPAAFARITAPVKKYRSIFDRKNEGMFHGRPSTPLPPLPPIAAAAVRRRAS